MSDSLLAAARILCLKTLQVCILILPMITLAPLSLVAGPELCREVLHEIPSEIRSQLVRDVARTDSEYDPTLEGMHSAKLFTRENFLMGQSIAASIMEVFPASDYYILSLGRSPTLITAIIQEYRPNYIKNFPLTVRPLVDPRSQDPFRKRQLLPEQQSAMEEFFARFLPPPEVLSGRKLVLMDFTMTGDSLRWATHSLLQYMTKRSISVPLTSLSLVATEKDRVDIADANRAFDPHGKQNWKFVKINLAFYELMELNVAKPFAEYNSYIPGGMPLTDVKASYGYRVLQNFVREQKRLDQRR